MGVWGTAVFSDDLASDIRGDYTNALGDGLSGPEATARILKDYSSSFGDPDESGVAWLALAATQWRCGRLEPETLEKAIAVIDSGSDLVRWKDSRDCNKRRAVLEKLRSQLTSPQPAAKKVAKHKLCESPWKEGDLFSYRLLTGRTILFRVTRQFTDKGGTYPVCKILDWVGDEIPSVETLRQTETKRSRADRKHTIHNVMLVGLSPKWARRIQSLNLNLTPFHQRLVNSVTASFRVKGEPASVVHFKYLDNFLKDWFLLE